MAIDKDPTDEEVERSIRKGRKYLNRSENSIEPGFLENDGLNPGEEISRAEENRESSERVEEDSEEFDSLSSDKEEDTTEGEITDTNTSE
jgi:hypothetical protein